MYGHHHSQPQGAHQPFSNQPRQQQGRSSADVLSQVLGFQVNQFPPRTQLPEELETALAVRGSRAEDRSFPGQMGCQNQHLPPMMDMHSGGGGRRDGQSSTELGRFSPGSDNQPGHQQGVNWSKYQAPSKLFAPSQPQHHHHHQATPPSQQPPHNSNPGSGQPWSPSVSEQPSLQQQPRGSRGGIDLHGLYVPESAGSILASFGLSNEDLEVLSHYPDDQLTPDTLPFILRDIQINKAENRNTTSSPSSSSFSQNVRFDHDVRPTRSADMPSLLSVTQTAGKVIDYGHASRATEESGNRETFKREQLPKERTIKTDYKSSSSSSASKRKSESTERRVVSMQMAKSNTYGDLDYRAGANVHKRSRSPVRKPAALPAPKSRLDRDYRSKGPKSNPSSETRSESASSKLPRSAASASVSSSKSKAPKKTPTPTMISDFVAEPPKIFPHTCSLCHVQCDMAKDWVDHLNTVNHTASCRDLRNRYPDWKPHPPQKAPSSVQDGSSKGPPKDRSPSRSVSRSLSWSQSPSPPDRQRTAPSSAGKPQPNPKQTEGRARQQPHPPGQSRGAGLPPGGRTSPSHSHRGSSSSSSSQSAEKRTRETSGSSSRDAKRPVAALSKPGPHAHPKPVSSSPSSAKGPSKPETPSPSSAKGPSKPEASKPETPSPSSAKGPSKPEASQPETPSPSSAKGPSKPEASKPVTSSPSSAKGPSKPEASKPVTSFPSSAKGPSKPLSKSSKAGSTKATSVKDTGEEKGADAQTTPVVVKSDVPTTKSNPDPDAPSNKVLSPTEPETENIQNNHEGLVLITGSTNGDWSESDIIKLAQPFGTPSDIIMSVGTGKALVSLADVQAAEEMVKAHALLPAEAQDSDLKMTVLKQHVSLRTPVALYNILQGTSNPLVAPVSWSSLLVVQNVPSTPTGPTEVKKLVQRFGAVRNALCLSHNMIIFEMAASSIALAVHKRFQKYPCIIQNNSLAFSRQTDPKSSTNSKVLSASTESSSKDSQNAQEPWLQAGENGKEDQTETHEEAEALKPAGDGEQEGPDVVCVSGRPEQTDPALPAAPGHGADPEADSLATGTEQGQTGETGDPQSNAKSLTQQTEAMDTSAETTEDPIPVSQAGPPEVTEEDSKVTEEDSKVTAEDSEVTAEDSKVVPESPKVVAEAPKITPEILKALLEECRSRSISRVEQNQNPHTTEERGSAEGGEKKGGSKTKPEKERHNQKKDDKERNGGKEGREKEMERAKREKEKYDSVERHERGKMDAARRERDSRRSQREGSSRSTSSGRSEVTRQSWRRGEGLMQTTVADEANKEEDCEDSGPFDMEGFVTVDEVGEVEELPAPPLLSQTHGNGTPPLPEDTPPPVSEATPTLAPTPTPEQVTPPLRSSTPDLTREGGSLSPGAPPTTAPGVQVTLSEGSPALLLAPGPEPPCTSMEVSPEKEESGTVPEETGEAAREEEEEEEEKRELQEEAVKERAVKTPMGAEEVQTEQSVVTVEEAGTVEEEEEEEEEEDGSTGTGVLKRSRSPTEGHEKEVEGTKRQKTNPGGDYVLPPYNAQTPIGMEFLLPKTGFFCKACSRFYTGGLEAKRSHCKTLKHYQSLQKYLGMGNLSEAEACGAEET